MLTIVPLAGLPEVVPGDDLAALLVAALPHGETIGRGDILVVTQKIVSKAEGRFVDLASVVPSAEAVALAEEVGKDASLIELVLRESTDIVRKGRNVLITRHRLGHVMANAGIDASNIGPHGQGPNGQGKVLLLPEDPDASAARIADGVAVRTGTRPAVLISDSFGRPWRMGVTNVAIGLAGMAALVDQRGATDRDGRVLQVTQIALGDAVAAAAGLVMGEGDEGLPAALRRGARGGGRGAQGAAHILMLADQQNAPDLKRAASVFVAQNAQAVMASKGWETLCATRPKLLSEVMRAMVPEGGEAAAAGGSTPIAAPR